MWATLLVIAAVVSVEPVRIGLTVLMLNRQRPLLQLLAFLCGGFVMGFGVGLLVLFLLWDMVLIHTNFTVAKVQIAIGALALIVALVLAANLMGSKRVRRPLATSGVGGDAVVVLTEPASQKARQKLSSPARILLHGSSLWVAGVGGLAIALPSGEYTAALAVIAASRAALAIQAAALLVFNIVAFTLVEIPLVSYLVAPDKTRAAIAALHGWIQTRRRRDIAGLVAAAGVMMIALGMIGL